MKVGQIISYVYAFEQWNTFHQIVYTLSLGHRIFWSISQLFCLNFVIQFIKHGINEKQDQSLCLTFFILTIDHSRCIVWKLYCCSVVCTTFQNKIIFWLQCIHLPGTTNSLCVVCVAVNFNMQIFISWRWSCNQHHWFVTHFHFVQYNAVQRFSFLLCHWLCMRVAVWVRLDSRSRWKLYNNL